MQIILAKNRGEGWDHQEVGGEGEDEGEGPL